jgi:hypothetical protein
MMKKRCFRKPPWCKAEGQNNLRQSLHNKNDQNNWLMQTHQDPKDFHWQIVHSLWPPKQVAMLEQPTFNKTHKGPLKHKKKSLLLGDQTSYTSSGNLPLCNIYETPQIAPTNGKSVSKIGIKATQLKTTCKRNRET